MVRIGESPSDTFNPDVKDAPLFLFVKLLSHQLSAAGIPATHTFAEPKWSGLINFNLYFKPQGHPWVGGPLFNSCVGFAWEEQVGDLGLLASNFGHRWWLSLPPPRPLSRSP